MSYHILLRGAAVAAALTISTQAAAETVVVTGAQMLDVLSGRTIDKPQIVIKDGRIVSVGRAGDAVPPDARQVDVGNRTLLPGLIDMHVHLTVNSDSFGYNRLSYTDSYWMTVGVANARKTLSAGFTTVRNAGSFGYDDVGLKQGIDRGIVDGPRIIPATYPIGSTGGHCDRNELPPSITPAGSNIANSPDGFRELVRRNRKYGAEVIKVCMTGGVISKGDGIGVQQLTYDEIKAIVDEAHRLGMKVAAHAHGPEGINDALRAGVDTIEHASLADQTSFRLAKEGGAWFDMDIYGTDYVVAQGERLGWFPESLRKEREVGLKQRQTFKAAHAAGVKITFGTDAGIYPHGDNAKQFAKMIEWGMTPLEAIRAATRDAAEALGRSKDVGAIAVGRYGDLIAVDGDPLSDVRLLEKVGFVIKGGEVVARPQDVAKSGR